MLRSTDMSDPELGTQHTFFHRKIELLFLEHTLPLRLNAIRQQGIDVMLSGNLQSIDCRAQVAQLLSTVQ